MAVKDPLKDFLNSLAEEIKADKPQKGEYTVTTFREFMKVEHDTVLSQEETDTWLKRWVEEGKATVREGHGKKGRPCKIYKPILN